MLSDSRVQEPRPTTELDFQAQLTEPFISGDYVNPSFKNRFIDFEEEVKFIFDNSGAKLKDSFGNDRLELVLNEQGNPIIKMNDDLFSIFNLWVRDWRLGNLNHKEVCFVRYYLDLASDFLVIGGKHFKSSAFICIERALGVIEVSQSKGGFLRKLINTIIQKTDINENEPQKRSLFGLGGKKNNKQGGY